MFSRNQPPESTTGEPGTQSSAASPSPNPHNPASSPTHSQDARGGHDNRDPFAPASKLTASTIGTDLTILGEKITIISQHLLQIDGDVRADINGKKVLIGQEGSVIGTITAETVEIHGGLRGAVKAQSVSLQPTAQVEGDIHHETLAIAEGAEFDGSVRRPKNPSDIKPNLDPASFQNGTAPSANKRTTGT